MMVGEVENIQIQYNEVMRKYNELKIEIKDALDKNVTIQQLDKDIQQIIVLVQNAKDQLSCDTDVKFQLKRQDQRVLQLKRLIEEEQQRQKQNQTVNEQGQIQKLQRQLNEKNEILSSNPNVVIDEVVVDKAVSENHIASDMRRIMQSLQIQISELQQENRQVQLQFQDLCTSSRQKEQQYEIALKENIKGEQIQKEKTSHIQKLEKELRQLDEEFDILKGTLEGEKARHVSKADRRKHQVSDGQLSDLQQLRDKLMSELKLKQIKRGVQRDQLINQTKILNQQKQQLFNTQKQHNILDKHSQQLEKKTSQLRNKLKHSNEQQRTTFKNKEDNNYKHQILQLESQIQLLHKQIQRQRNKHNQLAKVHKTYISKDQLKKLQEQYNKLKVIVRPLQSEQRKNKRLLDQKKLLTDKIQYLRWVDQRAIAEKISQIGQIKAKVKGLFEHIQFYASSVACNQVKLDEYMKEYPNHENQKELRKKARKQLKASDQNIANQEGSENLNTNRKGQTSAKKRRNRKKVKGTQQPDQQLLTEQGSITSSQNSINQTYKINKVQAASLIAIITFSIITFLMLN